MRQVSKRKGRGQVVEHVKSPQEENSGKKKAQDQGSQKKKPRIFGLKSVNPSVLYVITGAKNLDRRYYDLLCTYDRTEYSIDRFYQNCLLRAIKYDTTVEKLCGSSERRLNDVDATKANIVRISDETREILIAMGLGAKRYNRSGKIHGNLNKLSSYGICYIFGKDDLKRARDHTMEVVLLNGKKDKEVFSDEEFRTAEQQELLSLAEAFKEVLGFKEEEKKESKKDKDVLGFKEEEKRENIEYPPFYADWMKLVNRMGNTRDPKLMWLVMTHPILWSHVERRSFFEALWLRLDTVPIIIRAIESLQGYTTWKEEIPDSGPLRQNLDKNDYDDTSLGLYRFIRCVYKHICDKKRVEVAPTDDNEEKKFEFVYIYIDENTESKAYKNQKYVEMMITNYFPNFLPELYKALVVGEIYA